MASKLIIDAPACCDLDALADEAERIADMIREGFLSGEVEEGGWWHIEAD